MKGRMSDWHSSKRVMVWTHRGGGGAPGLVRHGLTCAHYRPRTSSLTTIYGVSLLPPPPFARKNIIDAVDQSKGSVQLNGEKVRKSVAGFKMWGSEFSLLD